MPGSGVRRLRLSSFSQAVKPSSVVARFIPSMKAPLMSGPRPADEIMVSERAPRLVDSARAAATAPPSE